MVSMKQFIYADNAATTKLDLDALNAMKPYLLDDYANASQIYLFAKKPREAIVNARSTIAKCINALPEEIFFTSGGTESNNWAIKGLPFPNGGKIITTEIEHYSVLKSCKWLEKIGCSVIFLPVTQAGEVSERLLKTAIDLNTRLVSVMYANNEIGTIQPIKKICETAHRCGVPFHTDAVQAIGHIPVDVRKIGVDMLSASAHKFNGPKGIGFLYVKKGTQLYSYMHGGAQELGMRAGTENIASIVGMAVALEKNCNNIHKNSEYVLMLEKVLLNILTKEKIDFKLNGSKHKLPGVVSLSFKNKSAETILHRMDIMGICISAGAACNSTNIQISHVLKAVNLSKSYADGTVRISFSKDNTAEEARLIAEAIIKIENE